MFDSFCLFNTNMLTINDSGKSSATNLINEMMVLTGKQCSFIHLKRNINLFLYIHKETMKPNIHEIMQITLISKVNNSLC